MSAESMWKMYDRHSQMKAILTEYERELFNYGMDSSNWETIPGENPDGPSVMATQAAVLRSAMFPIMQALTTAIGLGPLVMPPRPGTVPVDDGPSYPPPMPPYDWPPGEPWPPAQPWPPAEPLPATTSPDASGNFTDNGVPMHDMVHRPRGVVAEGRTGPGRVPAHGGAAGDDDTEKP